MIVGNLLSHLLFWEKLDKIRSLHRSIAIDAPQPGPSTVRLQFCSSMSRYASVTSAVIMDAKVAWEVIPVKLSKGCVYSGGSADTDSGLVNAHVLHPFFSLVPVRF